MNRRSHPRVRLVCPAVVWIAPASEDELSFPADQEMGMRVVQVDSLSLGGLSFVSVGSLPVGAPIWVRVRLGSKTCQFKGVVRRVAPAVQAGRTHHRCGVQFMRSQQTAHAISVISSFMEAANLRQSH
ncbi:MAG: PilZ domain-containing protein [Capsulimonas sp.]